MTKAKKENLKKAILGSISPYSSFEVYITEGEKKEYLFIDTEQLKTGIEDRQIEIAAYLSYLAERIRRGEVTVYINGEHLKRR